MKSAAMKKDQHRPLGNKRALLFKGGEFTNAAIVFLISFLPLAILHDRNGYEGDDLNSIVPMFNLREALDGLLLIYRYDWQPLSYNLGALIYDITGNPNLIFLMAPLSIALALAVLYSLAARFAQTPIWVFFCLILLTPEILYTGLYYNSVAPAYACAVGALAVMLRVQTRRGAAVAGVLMGLAFLFRVDFILIAPALWIAYLLRWRRLDLPVVAGVVLCAVMLAAFASGFIQFDRLLEDYITASTELVDKANAPGWDLRTKLFVATLIFSTLGWLYYGAGTIRLFIASAARERLYGALVAIAAAPALISIPNILSVKYMMPIFVLLPLLAALIWRRLQEDLSNPRHKRLANGGLVAATVFLIAFSIDVDNQAPFIKPSVTDARQIGTHDGNRSWGAYAMQMMRMNMLAEPSARQREGAELAASVQQGAGKTVVWLGCQTYFSDGAAGWRHAQLELAKRGYRTRVEGTGLLKASIGANTLWLADAADSIPADVLQQLGETIVVNRLGENEICQR